MKILFVITSLGMGGAEHVVTNLADELSNQGHKVKIAYLTGELLVTPRNNNIEVINLGLNSPKNLLNSYLLLRSIIKNFDPDVVHSHMYHANILTRLTRLSIKTPKLISTSHSNNEGGLLRMITYRITDSLTDMSTNVSKTAVDAFVNKGAVPEKRMTHIVNGIDTNTFNYNESERIKLRKKLSISDTQVILAVGRLEAAKDYPNLLKAIAILKAKRKDFKLLIVGDGSLKDDLTMLRSELKLEGFIEFLGIRRDIPALMSASDVFVLSSAWEGFGLVVAEAMACERVVVATNCGGVSEVVGSEGFLVEPRNSILLAKELNKALDLSDDERSLIGLAARKRIINHYSLEANVDAYLKLYR